LWVGQGDVLFEVDRLRDAPVRLAVAELDAVELLAQDALDFQAVVVGLLGGAFGLALAAGATARVSSRKRWLPAAWYATSSRTSRS
jgi:hypothetical protein